MWATVVNATVPGSVKAGPLDLGDFTEVPTNLTLVATGLGACAANTDGNTTTYVKIASLPADLVDGSKDGVYCIDGSSTGSPKFALDANGSVRF